MPRPHSDFDPAILKLEAKRRYCLAEAERLRQLIPDVKAEAVIKPPRRARELRRADAQAP